MKERIAPPKWEDVPALKDLWQRVFGDTEAFLQAYFSLCFGTDRCLCLWQGDTLAAMVHWIPGTCRGEPWAYLYAVAVEPDFRGRGICSRLLKALPESLGAYQGAVLAPAEKELFSLYEKCGFSPCAPAKNLTVCGAGTGEKLTFCSWETYREARKKWVPAGEFLPEDAGWRLLADDARFCLGDTFCFYGTVSGDTLTAPEFFGDPAVLPRILGTMGLSRGCVTCPGDQDAAMYRVFRGDAEAPAYLGLPLG